MRINEIWGVGTTLSEDRHQDQPHKRPTSTGGDFGKVFDKAMEEVKNERAGTENVSYSHYERQAVRRYLEMYRG